MKNKVRYLFSDKETPITKPIYFKTINSTVIAIGKSALHVTSSVASTKFISIYVDITATSGDNRAIYNRLYFKASNSGGGESLRSYTLIDGAYTITDAAHGAHITLGMGESTTTGRINGLGAAVRAQLGLASAALLGGTYTALQAEIYAFGASCQPSGVTELSFIRCVAGGHATGRQEIDDKAYLLVLDGVAEGAGNMVVASATETNYASAARCKINGVEKWLMFASASG